MFYHKDKGKTYILLGRRNIKPHKGYWSIPGGRAESRDETFLDTAWRETKEELGWEKFANLKKQKVFELDSTKTPHVNLTIPIAFKYTTFLVQSSQKFQVSQRTSRT